MSNQLKEEKIARAREALQMSRDLRRSRRELGVDGIRQFVKDVDGDWLENWSDTPHKENAITKQKVLKARTLFYYIVIKPSRAKQSVYSKVKGKFKSLVGTLKDNH